MRLNQLERETEAVGTARGPESQLATCLMSSLRAQDQKALQALLQPNRGLRRSLKSKPKMQAAKKGEGPARGAQSQS